MDRVGADFFRVVEMMKDKLGANPLPLQIPIGAEDEFRGIVDLIEEKALIYLDDLGTQSETQEVPAELAATVEKYRNQLFGKSG